MGGLLRSLDAVKHLRKMSIPIIVGAQVGETSVLTRAALPVAQAAGEALYAQEGAFGTRLLQQDICPSPSRHVRVRRRARHTRLRILRAFRLGALAPWPPIGLIPNHGGAER